MITATEITNNMKPVSFDPVAGKISAKSPNNAQTPYSTSDTCRCDQPRAKSM